MRGCVGLHPWAIAPVFELFYCACFQSRIIDCQAVVLGAALVILWFKALTFPAQGPGFALGCREPIALPR